MPPALAAGAAFDAPLSVQTVPPRSDTDPNGQLRCTRYAGLMVRETGTESPAPGAASLIEGATKPGTCPAALPGNAKPLPTEDYFLAGRKGPFLVFEEADPFGVFTFMVLDAATGQVLFSDSHDGRGFSAVTVEKDTLRLSYTRGVKADCSLLENPAACWPRVQLPPGVASQKPPVEACAAAYRTGTAPPNDPSIVLYPAEAAIPRTGAPVTQARGALGCAPMP